MLYGSSFSIQPAADGNSKNAQKKAAKKAALAAKKAQHKQQAAAGGGATTPDTTAAPAMTKAAPKLPPPMVSLKPTAGPKPNQVIINPNVPLTDRPVIALSVAVLTGAAVALDITADHRSRMTVLGTQQQNTPVQGDLAMARYFARQAGWTNDNNSSTVDTWVDYAQSLKYMTPPTQRVTAVALTLEHALQHQTYLVGTTLSLADLAVFAALGFPAEHTALQECLRSILPSQAVAAQRWIRMMACHPAVQEATQLCMGITERPVEVVFDPALPLAPLEPGMCALEGAVPGRVVTRFPPEPSGYLHIGHAKAVLLNDYYAKRYKGRLIVRFDDTNPSKEKEEFQESIIADLARLGVRPNLVTFTSDYFGPITAYAESMIRKGLAFMDDTPQEIMKEERGARQNSKHRDQTPEEAMEMFKLMCSGSPDGSVWCLRAKIDMQSNNGTLRDPVLFRQNLTPHHRSGTTYKAYPTYDLACPIVDSLEGVTHALRTTEYDDRNAQYHWIQHALGLRRSRIHSFARVNFKRTVLSKRKLTWFVENGHVTGWDDARFPTVRGVVRRGLNVTALRQFMYSLGASKRDTLMDWNAFWAENRKELDTSAKRFMAIQHEQQGNNASLLVTNGPEAAANAYVETTCHPKDPSMGTRAMRTCRQVFLEAMDVEGLQVGDEIALMRWCVVKLTKVDGVQLEGALVPDGNFKTTKAKLSWIADVPENTQVTLMEFDNLMSKDKLEEGDNFEDFINPDTLAATDVIGEAGLKMLHEHDVIQLERRGYYRVDRPYVNSSRPIVLYMVPDGKSKAMSGQKGKLGHR